MSESNGPGNGKAAPFILIADDNDDIRDLVVAFFRVKGWRVDEAKSAREILEKVNTQCTDMGHCYDAIISDVNFQLTDVSMTGTNAAREIRKEGINVPIVLISAYSSALVREEARKYSDEFLEKPLDFDKLFARVEFLIELSRIGKCDYDGPERRRTSINRSGQMRRATDKTLTMPAVLETLLAQVAEDKRKAAANHEQ